MRIELFAFAKNYTLHIAITIITVMWLISIGFFFGKAVLFECDKDTVFAITFSGLLTAGAALYMHYYNSHLEEKRRKERLLTLLGGTIENFGELLHKFEHPHLIVKTESGFDQISFRLNNINRLLGHIETDYLDIILKTSDAENFFCNG